MSDSFYKFLGILAWKGARMHARDKVAQRVPSRRVVGVGAAAVLALAVAGAVLSARRGD